MNSRKHSRNAGFTLVEILIVVVILGILSAIVIPQFTSASDTAKANAMTTQLQTIRSQLELYRVQHGDEYPDLVTTGWDLLTKKTNADHTTTGTPAMGPYLQKAPSNPVGNSKTIVVIGGTEDAPTAAAGGWAYNNTTGKILAIVTEAQATQLGLSVDDGDIAIAAVVADDDDD